MLYAAMRINSVNRQAATPTTAVFKHVIKVVMQPHRQFEVSRYVHSVQNQVGVAGCWLLAAGCWLLAAVTFRHIVSRQ